MLESLALLSIFGIVFIIAKNTKKTKDRKD